MTAEHMQSVRQAYGSPSNPFTLDIRASEPMDLAFRLLRELSPEARVARRSMTQSTSPALSVEISKNSIGKEEDEAYGSHNRKDVSHTQGGRLTLEGEHANRARHFKNRGTLRVV